MKPQDMSMIVNRNELADEFTKIIENFRRLPNFENAIKTFDTPQAFYQMVAQNATDIGLKNIATMLSERQGYYQQGWDGNAGNRIDKLMDDVRDAIISSKGLDN